MPKKRSEFRAEQPELEQIQDNVLLSPEQEKEILERVLVPHLEELLRKELESALADTRDSAIVRGRLLDRLVGKPTERKVNQQQPKIVVNLLQVTGPGQTTVTTQVIEGELVQPPELPEPEIDLAEKFGFNESEIGS